MERLGKVSDIATEHKHKHEAKQTLMATANEVHETMNIRITPQKSTGLRLS